MFSKFEAKYWHHLQGMSPALTFELQMTEKCKSRGIQRCITKTDLMFTKVDYIFKINNL